MRGTHEAFTWLNSASAAGSAITAAAAGAAIDGYGPRGGLLVAVAATSLTAVLATLKPRCE